MNNEQLREEFDKEIQYIPYMQVMFIKKRIADWWLDKMAAHHAKEMESLRERVKELKDPDAEGWGYTKGVDDVLAIMREEI